MPHMTKRAASKHFWKAAINVFKMRSYKEKQQGGGFCDLSC